ncbi:MAG: hypothetical protein JO041_09975 [Acidobacteria bacterium]|nr:hypothetical protein [Acidobacteriota bacterium]
MAALTACLVAGTFPAAPHRERASSVSTALTPASIAFDHGGGEGSNWDVKAAAAYLDKRQGWWMEWPRAQRDHQTFCVSCHTAVPYALSRFSLRAPLGEHDPSPNERKLLDNVVRRVRLWREVAPFYSDAERGPHKTAESRGTESVLNALILASRDAQGGQLSSDARTAFDNMWAEQQIRGDNRGAWLWLRFNNEPWEANDSDFYGATLAAVAIGAAPADYRATPEVRKRTRLLAEYLQRESARQTILNRVALLWAAAKLPGLMERASQEAIVAELLSRQQPDGGWSLPSLVGDWKRADGTPQEQKSDGYSTGIIVFALEQAGSSGHRDALRRGIAWLTANQDKSAGSWPAYSLNKNEEHHISPATALFMRDAATSYAVLALSAYADTSF